MNDLPMRLPIRFLQLQNDYADEDEIVGTVTVNENDIGRCDHHQ